MNHTYAEITYVTEDGVEHKKNVLIANHPVISLNRVFIGGIEIPKANIRLYGQGPVVRLGVTK